MTRSGSIDTAIVGVGLAGTVVAACLARTAHRGYRAMLFDPSPAGPGTAYAAPSDELLMNGPARSMSAMPGDTAHLLRWLGAGCEDALISRNRYGRYLIEILGDALARHPGLTVAREGIVDIEADRYGFRLLDTGGSRYFARSVVLALGNLPPDDSFLPETVRAHGGYIGDPWRFDANKIRGDSIALVGSGLTAMDAIALLDEREYRGTVHLISRHGLLPAIENPCARSADPARLDLQTQTPLALLHSLRRAAGIYQQAGGDWREIVESIRKLSPSIWAAWPQREKRRFLRHLQSFWSVHRYRVPARTAQAFERFEARGQIIRHKGRIVQARRSPTDTLSITIVRGDRSSAVEATDIVNCTGPGGDLRRSNSQLVRNIMRRGLIRPDALRLGIDATADLHAIDSRGDAQSALFTLGPPLRGLFYETTAVPETRDQATRIAQTLVRMHTHATLEAVS